MSETSDSALPEWVSDSSAPSVLLYVKPGAKTDAVLGTFNGRLKLALAAPATEGKANAALIRFLSRKLDVPKSALTLAQGTSSRLKRVTVSGLTPADIVRKLAP